MECNSFCINIITIYKYFFQHQKKQEALTEALGRTFGWF